MRTLTAVSSSRGLPLLGAARGAAAGYWQRIRIAETLLFVAVPEAVFSAVTPSSCVPTGCPVHVTPPAVATTA
jgi:hypothetical protein